MASLVILIILLLAGTLIALSIIAKKKILYIFAALATLLWVFATAVILISMNSM